MSQKFDIATYIWPAYTGNEKRAYQFWPEKIGEWQSVISAEKKFTEHSWPRRPLWGYVNEADPYVMEMQINAAADHGVNVFIYDWYWYDSRPFLENCLNEGYLKARNKERVKFYLMWANHDATNLWDKRNSHVDNTVWLGSVSRNEFDKLVKRIISKYFSEPTYYKIDNKPVFMIYDIPSLVRGLGGIDNTKKALNYFREETIKAGFTGLYLQMVIWKENAVKIQNIDPLHTGSTKDIATLLGFDSVTHYQFVQFTNVDRDYRDILADVNKEWDRISCEYKMPYHPHISLGWDNNPRFKEFIGGIVKNNTPENIKKGFEMAKKYLENNTDIPPLITINSWNEWTETSYLQPDDLYGYGYLNALKDVFIDN